MGVVQQAVEQGGGQRPVLGEAGGPLAEGQIAGDDDAGSLHRRDQISVHQAF